MNTDTVELLAQRCQDFYSALCDKGWSEEYATQAVIAALQGGVLSWITVGS